MTIGELEKLLREFDSTTSISVNCDTCNRGSLGTNIIKIEDRTNQTYGYIELTINHNSQPKVELAINEKEFYEKEIAKLSNKIYELETMLRVYKEEINGVCSVKDTIDKRIKYILD